MSATYDFGVFHLDATEHQLLRDGRPVPLPPKAFDLLVDLVEHAGHLREKKQLMDALWPGTFVEEVNLAYTVSALRKALGDTREKPEFIETVPTRGYRFVASVVRHESHQAPASGLPAPGSPAVPPPVPSRRVLIRALVPLVPAVVAIGVAAFGWWRYAAGTPTASAGPLDVVQLTANPADRPIGSARLSPDGRYLAYADAEGIKVRVIDTSEVIRLADTAGMNVYAWTSDGTRVRAASCESTTCVGWDVSVIGGARRRSGATWPRMDAIEANADGSKLLRMTESGDLVVDPLDGREHVVAKHVWFANWTYDQQGVFFTTDSIRLKRVPTRGGASEIVFATTSNPVTKEWIIARVGPGLREGRVLLVLQRWMKTGPYETALWAVSADGSGARDGPRQLTPWHEGGVNLTASFDNGDMSLSASADRRRVAFLRVDRHEDVYVAAYQRDSGLTGPPRRLTLDERDDRPSGWLPDSTAVLFASVRSDALDVFTQRLDSAVAEPLVVGRGSQRAARVTSDGRWVLYQDELAASIMRTPVAGGASGVVYTFPDGDMGHCHCSFRGRCVLMRSHEDEYIVSEIDPERGKGRDLVRLPMTTGAALSPDGDGIAYVVPAGDNGVRNRIRILSFTGEKPRDIAVAGAVGLSNLDALPQGGWMSHDERVDGASWQPTRLLFIREDGVAHEWWRPPAVTLGAAISSPDGRYLAIGVTSVRSDAWMIDGL